MDREMRGMIVRKFIRVLALREIQNPKFANECGLSISVMFSFRMEYGHPILIDLDTLTVLAHMYWQLLECLDISIKCL